MLIRRERETLYVIILSLTAVWALIATCLAVSRSSQVLVFVKDETGIHSINDKSDEMKKREMVLLSQRFVDDLYNYNSTTFKERILSAKSIMNNSLWDRHLKEFDDLNDRLKKIRLSQTATIEGVSRQDDKIRIVLLLVVATDLESTKRKLIVTLSLENHERSLSNPYQYEVSDYEESSSVI